MADPAQNQIDYYDSPMGRLTLVSDGTNLTGLWFEGLGGPAAEGRPIGASDPPVPALSLARGWLDQYFSGRIPDVNVPLGPKGTKFQEVIWAHLSTIPFGRVTTYGVLATKMGGPVGLARAVGQATGKNPVSIIIPCHRVIGADGSLTGFAAGLDRKERLLALEAETMIKAGNRPWRPGPRRRIR
jgi:methylated-DNA-[protein]-cysteine S-methyltransferase